MGPDAVTVPALALVNAAVSGVTVGVALVATGSIVDEAGPITIAFIRYSIGVLFLLPLALSTSWKGIPIRDLVPIGLLGIFQFAILMMLLNYAVIYIDVGLVALIFATLPLMTMLLAVGLGQESFTNRKVIGILLTIVGVAFAVGVTAFSRSLDLNAWLGIGASFLATLSGAVCSVYYKPYLLRYPTGQISTVAMLASALFLSGLAVYEGLLAVVPTFDTRVWLVMLFIGLSASVGYFTLLYAIRHIPASNATVFMGLSPISAAVFAAFFIDQPLTIEDLTGCAFVATGLVISLWQRRTD
ncbi:MAG: DMT family transporter [Proteobacteria bacterium]|nr:DMT family transporter [Pseudomonadota bacterium]